MRTLFLVSITIRSFIFFSVKRLVYVLKSYELHNLSGTSITTVNSIYTSNTDKVIVLGLKD